MNVCRCEQNVLPLFYKTTCRSFPLTEGLLSRADSMKSLILNCICAQRKFPSLSLTSSLIKVVCFLPALSALATWAAQAVIGVDIRSTVLRGKSSTQRSTYRKWRMGLEALPENFHIFLHSPHQGRVWTKPN